MGEVSGVEKRRKLTGGLFRIVGKPDPASKRRFKMIFQFKESSGISRNQRPNLAKMIFQANSEFETRLHSANELREKEEVHRLMQVVDCVLSSVVVFSKGTAEDQLGCSRLSADAELKETVN
ncbi:hypothetical protein TNCV_3051811 [Trichonephila clavipes]|nr:hypothetical protein TNCV_3051811 [Trichonephila clavipes]